jgi:hypothetical protein
MKEEKMDAFVFLINVLVNSIPAVAIALAAGFNIGYAIELWSASKPAENNAV